MSVSFSEIKAVRLRIFDPAECIDILEVANAAALPSAPASQTVYMVASTGAYVATEKTIGATSSDYLTRDLMVSDTSISDWLALGGESRAVETAIRRIMISLGQKMNIVRMSNGSESTDFTSLKDIYDFYKNMITICKEEDNVKVKNSTGRSGASKAPTIAGGLI